MWEFYGQKRPDFAQIPTPDQESVWDFPRPPALQQSASHIVIKARQQEIANTTRAIRVLETASPPGFYIPPSDIDFEQLIPLPGSSICEWKGTAKYWALAQIPQFGVAWSYLEPNEPFQEIAGYLSFYPSLVECFVDGEKVRQQPGRFYGGWVTDKISGPFKGDPGTGHW